VIETVFFNVSETPTQLYKLCDGIELKHSWNDYSNEEKECLMSAYEFLQELASRNLLEIKHPQNPRETGLQHMLISLCHINDGIENIQRVVESAASHCAQRRWVRMNQHSY